MSNGATREEVESELRDVLADVRTMRREMAALRAENAALKADAAKWRRLDGAQLAEAVLNAARYCWLRSHPVFQVKELPNELELLDASIDPCVHGPAGTDRTQFSRFSSTVFSCTDLPVGRPGPTSTNHLTL